MRGFPKLFAVATVTNSARGSPAYPDTGHRYFKWTHRLVLIFPSNKANAAAAEQRDQWLVDVSGWWERNLLLIEVGLVDCVTVNGAADVILKSNELRRAFSIDPTRFTAILVGKDGVEKVRSDVAFNNADLYRLIDAMPMRRQEMSRLSPLPGQACARRSGDV